MSFASPGVTIREIDKTTSLTTSDQQIACVVIAARRGPVNKVTYVRSERELVEVFGEPDDNNFESWFSAAAVIAYGGVVAVIRPNDLETDIRNANSSLSGSNPNVIISTLEDYQNANSTPYYFAARSAGAESNGLEVHVIDHGADQILTIEGVTPVTTSIQVNNSTNFVANLATGDLLRIGKEYLTVGTINATSLNKTNPANIPVSRGSLGTASTAKYKANDLDLVKWTLAENPETYNTMSVSEAVVSTTEQYITISGLIPTEWDVNDYLKLKRTATGGTTTFEYVRIISLDTDTNTVKVSRAALGTTAGNFSATAGAGETNVEIKLILIDFVATSVKTKLTSPYPAYTQINDRTIQVASATGLATGNFIRLNTEYLRITDIVGTTLTVSRAALGSTEVARFNAGTTVTKWNLTTSSDSADVVTMNNTAENPFDLNEVYFTFNEAVPTTFTVGSFLILERKNNGTNTQHEYVKILGIDTETKTVEVQRGQLGTANRKFDSTVRTGESNVTVTATLVIFAASATVTTTTEKFPSYVISQFDGDLGDIVKVGTAVNSSVQAWVYDIGYDTMTVTLRNPNRKFKINDDLFDADGNVYLGKVVGIQDYYATRSYGPRLRWSAIAPQPGTSDYARSRGGLFDQMHIIVVDRTGKITGTPYTVIEKFLYVSKATDAKTTDGDVTFWKKVIEQKSNYIYGGDDFYPTQGLNLTVPPGTAFVQRNINDSVSNSLFDVIRTSGGSSALKFVFGSGKDYPFAVKRDIVENAITNAYQLVADPEDVEDIDYLIPGSISFDRANKLIEVAESRRDCLAFISPLRTSALSNLPNSEKTFEIIEFFETLPSTSFAAFDSGYKYIYDRYNNIYRYVPCAADMAGLCVNSTLNAETWFSPAGFTRGAIKNCIKLAYNPRKSDRDDLYVRRINPIVTFPGQGTVLFGDKTALGVPSAFDRINVRRLFVELQKVISRLAKYQLFEINDEITRNTFVNMIEPYLRDVQARRGVQEFLVVCDGTNNTPDVIDSNEFNADIYIKPSRSINFITLTFVATRTGVSFSEVTV